MAKRTNLRSIAVAVMVIIIGAGSAWAFSGSGEGTEADPYIITTVEELQEMQNDLRASYVLGNDIDASATSGWNDGAGFTPVADWTEGFRGDFDGNGYVIAGLYINRPGGREISLFGTIHRGVAKNVGIIDAQIYGLNRVGVLAGWCVGNGLIENCWASGQVTISSDGSAEAKSGGLVGEVGPAILLRCYSEVNVTALSSRRQIGGLCGYLRGKNNAPPAIIENCYSTGTVTGDGWKVGGLLGDADGINATVSKCYSVGKVNGSHKQGLVGYNYSNPTILDSYWDEQTSGCSTSYGGAGKTTAQMMRQGTFVGWDFVGEDINGTDDIWWIDEGEDYPRLWWEIIEPVELLEILVQDVIDLELKRGTENRLLVKLNTILRKLEDDNEKNDATAINSLEAFINGVEAQSGKEILEADAEALIDTAQQIIDLLGSE